MEGTLMAMLTPEMISHLSMTYPESFLRWCREPTHCRLLLSFHARGDHRTASGDWIEFRLRLTDDRIAELAFSFEGRPVLLAAGEAVCSLGTGLSVTAALRACTEEAIAAELGELPDADAWNLMLVRESLRNCLLDAVAVSRQPWKGPYVK
ncbi:iron-sulfur cluster assembly scaffold protein [Myxococcota bacterium]|nr:iron-sulfur cluster assembly scaffold protein [Myxococcota bacterium]